MWVDVTENCSTPQPDGKRNPSEWLRPWASLTLIFIESYPPTPLQSHIASAKWVTLAGRKRTVKERKYHTIYMCLSLSRMVLNTGIQRMNVLNKWAQWNLKPKEIYQSSTDWNLSKQTRYLSCFHLSPSSNIEKTHPCYTLGTDKRYFQPFNADLVQGGLSFF